MTPPAGTQYPVRGRSAAHTGRTTVLSPSPSSTLPSSARPLLRCPLLLALFCAALFCSPSSTLPSSARPLLRCPLLLARTTLPCVRFNGLLHWAGGLLHFNGLSSAGALQRPPPLGGATHSCLYPGLCHSSYTGLCHPLMHLQACTTHRSCPTLQPSCPTLSNLRERAVGEMGRGRRGGRTGRQARW